MRILRNISLYLVISFTLCILSTALQSDFLFEYLNESIVGLLITLLAINTATTGLVASKIQDVIFKHPGIDLTKSIKEMKFSLFEQIILIILCLICLITLDSELIVFPYKVLALNSLLLAILIYAIDILWDTGKSVFVVIEMLQDMGGSK